MLRKLREEVWQLLHSEPFSDKFCLADEAIYRFLVDHGPHKSARFLGNGPQCLSPGVAVEFRRRWLVRQDKAGVNLKRTSKTDYNRGSATL